MGDHQSKQAIKVNIKLTKWQIDKVTNWQIDKVTNWQSDKLTNWQIDKEQQVGGHQSNQVR